MSKMFRRFFTRARDVKKGFRNGWKPRKHLADNPPESCGRWSRIVRSIGLNRAVVVRKADEETCQTVRPCTQRESTSVFD